MKLITLDEVYERWAGVFPGWPFWCYCEFLKSHNYRII